MVRFTLMNRCTNTSIRMDLSPDDEVQEIILSAIEVWNYEGVPVLRDGYRMLDPHSTVSGCINDGDLVEMLPDPFHRWRWDEIQVTSRAFQVFG